MAEIILDKINYTYSDGTAYEIQALKDVNLQIHQGDRKSTRLNSSHRHTSRMPSSA